MKLETYDRGFTFLVHPAYLPPHESERLASESSAIGEDSLDMPGSSFLWIGDKHHLNRTEVAELVEHLQAWLNTGRLGGGE